MVSVFKLFYMCVDYFEGRRTWPHWGLRFTILPCDLGLQPWTVNNL